MSIILLIPHWWHTVTLQCLEIWYHKPFSLFFIIMLDILGLLSFFAHFRISLLRSTKLVTEILIDIEFNLLIKWRKIGILQYWVLQNMNMGYFSIYLEFFIIFMCFLVICIYILYMFFRFIPQYFVGILDVLKL